MTAESVNDGKLTFPSLEWAEELARRLNTLPEYQDSAVNWKGTLVMAVLAEPGKLDRDYNIAMDPTGGTIKNVHLCDEAGRKSADFTLLAKFSVWKDVVQGKHDILSGVIRGKIRLRGQLFKLMLQLKTPEITMREMRNMPTRFADAEPR